MIRFATDETFSDYITQDFIWRLKEISDLRKIATSNKEGYEVAARKAGIALLYAHWEGYVKFVGEAYVKYVSVRKIRIDYLVDEFFAAEIDGLLRNYVSTPKDLRSRLALVDGWKKIEKERFLGHKEGGIVTGGNLNFHRFSEICRLIRIDPASVIKDSDYLDKNILGVRNKVAHGASITVTEGEFNSASEFVIESMRKFRNQTESCVFKKSYLRVPAR